MDTLLAPMSTLVKTSWSDWINEKYRQWRNSRVGHAAGVTEFGRQFGAGHQVVLGWLAPGSTPPRALKYINRLMDVYGEDEVMAVLGIDRLPRASALDQRTKRLVDLVNQVPESDQDQLIGLVEEFIRFAGYKRTQ